MIAFFEVLDRFLADYGIVHFTAREVAPVGKVAGGTESAPRLMPPPPELWGFVVPVLHVAEWLRVQVGNKPVIVTSGWRDQRYNRALKPPGASDSMHMQFNALDIKVAGFTGNALAKVLGAHPLSRYMGIGTYPNMPAICHFDTRGLIGRPAPARW